MTEVVTPVPTVDPKIHIKFSCKGCIIKGQLVAVRPRNSDEDVVGYLHNTVMPLVHQIHHAMSPLCISKHCDVALPFDPTSGRVAGPTLN